MIRNLPMRVFSPTLSRARVPETARSPFAGAFGHALLPRVLVAFGAVALGGCAVLGDAFTTEEVRPWERGVLAREDMQLVTDPMDDVVDDHLYFSREASTGGGSVRGGGCGCN